MNIFWNAWIVAIMCIACSDNHNKENETRINPPNTSASVTQGLSVSTSLTVHNILSQKSQLMQSNSNKFNRKDLIKITCSYFDFNTFKLKKGKEKKYEVYKDKNTDTVRIIHLLQSAKHVTVLYINYRENYRFIGINDKYTTDDDISANEDEMPTSLPSLIFFNGKKNCFIGMDYFLGHPNCNISSFMDLDSSLYPNFVLKFGHQKKGETQVNLSYKAKIIYGRNHEVLYGELYDTKSAQDYYVTTDQLMELINKKETLLKEKMVFSLGDYNSDPLWIFNGNHQYTIE